MGGRGHARRSSISETELRQGDLVGGGRVERGGEKRSSSQFIGRGVYLAQEGGTGIAFNRKNARGQVEGSSWRGEMCPLRGLVMGLVSEAFEPYRLNETPCKCPMVTTRMVAQRNRAGKVVRS